jgi:hypothetical protein
MGTKKKEQRQVALGLPWQSLEHFVWQKSIHLEGDDVDVLEAIPLEV